MNSESVALVFTVAISAASVLLIWFILTFMPRWTRRDMYFAVTVHPSFRTTDLARRLERRYRRLVALHTLIALALLLAGILLVKPLGLGLLVIFCNIAVFWQIIAAAVVFAQTRRAILPHAASPTTRRQASLQPRRATLAGGWAWLLPLLILVASAVCLTANWRRIPPHLATHYGVTGRPDAWAPRTPANVFLPLYMAAGIYLCFLLLAWAIVRFSRRNAPAGEPARREGKSLRLTQLIALAATIYLVLVMGAVSLMPLLQGPNDPLPAWFYWMIASELLFAVAVLIVVVRTGRDSWRLQPDIPSAPAAPTHMPDNAAPQFRPDSVDAQSKSAHPAHECDQPLGDNTPDAAWKLGIFYYNPSDPALFVPKRFGIGWDLNWARPAAWLIMLALVTLPLLTLLLLKLAQ